MSTVSAAVAERPTLIGSDKRALDTPALIVDLDVMDQNIARIAAACRDAGINWRPHTKGQKVPAIAQRLLAAGAIGITCAKLGEAEVMAAAGLRDILIANQIAGVRKITRLMELRRSADVMVAVDDPANIAALDAAARDTGVRLRVVIEVNIGLNRAGVEPGEPCVALADVIARHPGLSFAGVMSWEGHAAPIKDPAQKAEAVRAAVAMLTASADLCRKAGYPVQIVSCGGTGTYALSAVQPGVTEIQVGGGIFCDIHYRTNYGIEHPYAMTLMTTVTSRPNAMRVVCDAGKKAMSGDAALPQPIDLQGVKSVRLSAEHATIELTVPNHALRVGDPLEFVIGYTDTTVHLHDTMYGVRNGRVEAVWPVAARGRLQ
jgi:D-serine deaminase-like pyridoxal phosphate-dependent protein